MEIARADAHSPQLHVHALPNSQKEQKEHAKEGISAEVETTTHKKEPVEVSRVERTPQAPADSSSTDAPKQDGDNEVLKKAESKTNSEISVNPNNDKPKTAKIRQFGIKEPAQESPSVPRVLPKDQVQPREVQVFNQNGKVEDKEAKNSIVDVFV